VFCPRKGGLLVVLQQDMTVPQQNRTQRWAHPFCIVNASRAAREYTRGRPCVFCHQISGNLVECSTRSCIESAMPVLGKQRTSPLGATHPISGLNFDRCHVVFHPLCCALENQDFFTRVRAGKREVFCAKHIPKTLIRLDGRSLQEEKYEIGEKQENIINSTESSESLAISTQASVPDPGPGPGPGPRGGLSWSLDLAEIRELRRSLLRARLLTKRVHERDRIKQQLYAMETDEFVLKLNKLLDRPRVRQRTQSQPHMDEKSDRGSAPKPKVDDNADVNVSGDKTAMKDDDKTKERVKKKRYASVESVQHFSMKVLEGANYEFAALHDPDAAEALRLAAKNKPRDPNRGSNTSKRVSKAKSLVGRPSLKKSDRALLFLCGEVLTSDIAQGSTRKEYQKTVLRRLTRRKFLNTVFGGLAEVDILGKSMDMGIQHDIRNNMNNTDKSAKRELAALGIEYSGHAYFREILPNDKLELENIEVDGLDDSTYNGGEERKEEETGVSTAWIDKCIAKAPLRPVCRDGWNKRSAKGSSLLKLERMLSDVLSVIETLQIDFHDIESDTILKRRLAGDFAVIPYHAIPNYDTLVKRPLSLEVIRGNLQQHKYRTLKAFTNDFFEMLANARSITHPESLCWADTAELAVQVDALIDHFSTCNPIDVSCMPPSDHPYLTTNECRDETEGKYCVLCDRRYQVEHWPPMFDSVSLLKNPHFLCNSCLSKSYVASLLVGVEVVCWWHDDECFYPGIIAAYESFSGRYLVHYNDGDLKSTALMIEKPKPVKRDTIVSANVELEPEDDAGKVSFPITFTTTTTSPYMKLEKEKYKDEIESNMNNPTHAFKGEWEFVHFGFQPGIFDISEELVKCIRTAHGSNNS
jgi:hypothetical protein